MKKIIELNKNKINWLNNKCKEYKALIETIGIFAGVILVLYTYKSVSITQKQIREEHLKELPLWNIHVLDDENRFYLNLALISADAQLQQEAKVILPGELFPKKRYNTTLLLGI